MMMMMMMMPCGHARFYESCAHRVADMDAGCGLSGLSCVDHYGNMPFLIETLCLYVLLYHT